MKPKHSQPSLSRSPQPTTGALPRHVSRRRFMRLGAGAAGAASALSLGLIDPAAASATGSNQIGGFKPDSNDLRDSLERAYRFQNVMMDAYQSGTTLRLIQSYADQQGLGTTAFTYDNSLAIIAYLQRGKADDLVRARLLGDSLLYAQQHDPAYTDGRLRQAYWVAPFEIPGLTANADYFVKPNGQVNLVGFPWFFTGSAVGDMAWAAIALAQLNARTNDQRYLDGAVKLGRWIVDTTYDTRGPGGYNFGVDGNNTPLLYKSTEHNIDVYGLFTNLLAPLTKDQQWRTRGDHALKFIKAMWNAEAGLFYTGTTPDGVTINPSPLPEDPQSWSYLALLDPAYATALDWAKTNLATTDTPQSANASFTGNVRFSGVTFSNVSLRITTKAGEYDPPPDPDAVWFEGTAQMAAALLARKLPANRDLPGFYGDLATAAEYLDQIRLAQGTLGRGQTAGGASIPDNLGVVAASSVLNTGFGFSYFPNLHIGATAWYLIGGQAGNPYQLPNGRR